MFKYNLNINDKIIIIGSDGFWKYINNDEAINFIAKYYEDGVKAEEVSINIVEYAKNKWIEENIKNPSLFNYNNLLKNNSKKNKKNSYVQYNIAQNYEIKKEKKYKYDDITCLIVYLDIK